MRNQVAEQLKKIQGITFFSPLTGRFDLAIELKASDPKKVYELVNKVRSISGITSTRTYTPFEGFADSKKMKPTDALAVVLLRIEQQAVAQKVLQSMEQNPQVRNASVVSGEFDILATVYGKNQEEILTQVAKIDDAPGIRTSETLFAYMPQWQ
ncbi:MAG: Lrp/AsnC ligand binding domain-containing protein [Nitrososphaerales archaeon]|jgi:DNA-binding Lrp family transcriptional regulator